MYMTLLFFLRLLYICFFLYIHTFRFITRIHSIIKMSYIKSYTTQFVFFNFENKIWWFFGLGRALGALRAGVRLHYFVNHIAKNSLSEPIISKIKKYMFVCCPVRPVHPIYLVIAEETLRLDGFVLAHAIIFQQLIIIINARQQPRISAHAAQHTRRRGDGNTCGFFCIIYVWRGWRPISLYAFNSWSILPCTTSHIQINVY